MKNTKLSIDDLDKSTAKYSKKIHFFIFAILITYSLFAIGMAYETEYGSRASDFFQFWTASEICNNGNAPGVYKTEIFLVPCKEHLPDLEVPLMYPPVALLIFYPLAWFPRSISLVLWTLPGIFGFWIVIKKITKHTIVRAVIMTSPIILISIKYGNNGLPIAVLIGMMLLFLTDRPYIAGIIGSLVIYKPHMALLIPVFFLCSRQYKALTTFVISSLSLIIFSLGCFGIECWSSFMKMLDLLRGKFIEYNTVEAVVSIPHSVYMIWGSKDLAYVVQGALSLTILTGLVTCARKKHVDKNYLKALFIISILLFTPYSQVYDLAVSMVAFAFYIEASSIEKRALTGIDFSILFLLWLTPFLQFPFARYLMTHHGVFISISVPILIGFYIMTFIRIMSDKQPD